MAKRGQSLTPRETQVLQLLLAGKTNKMIGEELGISWRTIEVHRHRILTKRDARNVADLARMVAEEAAATTIAQMRAANDRLGAWMSAALDDPKVCQAMKDDINAWFASWMGDTDEKATAAQVAEGVEHRVSP